MPGSFGSPYRDPCGGWAAALKYYYACAKHWLASHHRLPIYPNTTLVTNPPWSECREADPAPGTPLTIYPIPRPACPSPATIGTIGCYLFEPCGPWPHPHPANTYGAALTTPKLDLAVCRKIGFKNLYAYKVWHGRYGFRSQMSDSPEYTAVTGLNDGTGGFACHQTPGVRLTIDDIRYRTLTVASSYTDTYSGVPGGNPPGESITDNSVDTVARYSGKHTGSRYKTGTFPALTGLLSPYLIDPFIGGTQSVPILLFESQAGPRVSNPGVTITEGAVVTYSEDLGGGVTISATLDLAAGSYSLSTANPSGDYQTQECQVSNTGYHFKFHLHTDIAGDGSGGVRDRIWETTWTLSDPYTGAQVKADLKTLLATWNLCNDALYPFRKDRGVTSGPLVCYNERGPQSPGVWPAPTNVDGVDVPYMDTSLPPHTGPDVADGAIAGAPLPVGSQPYFDFSHIHWAFVDGGVSGSLAVPGFYGQSNNRSENPNNISAFYHATQWVDNRMEKHLPPGPFRSLNSIYLSDQFGTAGEPLLFNESVYWGCDWVEAIIPRQSEDYFRPCGKDTLERDPSTVNCTSNPTGNLRWPTAFPICGRIAVTLATQNGANVDLVLAESADYLTSGKKVDFTGITGLGTNLTVTVTDPTHISVPGTLDVDHPYTTGGYVMSHGAPAYPWHDDQTKIDYLFKSWTYDFRDFWESYNVHLAYLGRDTGCPAPPDATPVRWIETAPQGDVSNHDIIGSGSFWMKSLTETPLCAARNPCHPAICIVSNNEQANCSNSTRVEPPDLTLDGKYGTFWIGRVEQWMTDPLWKAPGADYVAQICDEDAGCEAFEEDSVQDPDSDSRHMGKENYTNLSLQEVCIYPHRRYVEARKDLPTRNKSAGEGGGTETAPALPADALTIGCATWVADLNTDPPTTPPSRTSNCYPSYSHSLFFIPSLNPPADGHYAIYGEPEAYPMTWIIQLAQENTVRSGGRFSAEYAANGVK